MIFLYSQGGYAREFVRLVRLQYPGRPILFVDDAPSGQSISYAEALARRDGSSAMVIGFAAGALRAERTHRVLSDGFRLLDVRAPTSIVGDNVTLGPGAVLSDFAMITADARIGMGFQCNIYSYVAHDCVVGDFVTLAPRVSVNGRVHIDDLAYVGTGATILPGQADQPLRIGAGAVVGAHALVTKDVAPGTTVVGVPAKPVGPRS